MSTRVLAVWCLVSCCGTCWANNLGQVQVDSGIVALRSSAEGDWEIRRSGDELPESFDFRAGPQRVVRLEFPGVEILLGGETKGRWDGDQRRLSLSLGQALIRTSDNATPVLVMSASHQAVWKVPSSAEVIWLRSDNEAWHVLSGTMQEAVNAEEKITAPISLLLQPDGHVQTDVPEEPGPWAEKLTKWSRSALGTGQLVAKDAQDGSPVRLEIARYRVNVVMQAPAALVQIDQSFYNPYGTQQEGTFVFNLPPGASVSRFAMFVTPEQLIEGELIDRREADRIYTSIVRKQRDPAILEQIGDNLFRMRVFPIFARDTKRILLDFTIPLVSDRGDYRFELPLLSDVKPIWDFTIRGTIYPPVTAEQVRSYTHPELKFEALEDGRVIFAQAERMVRPPPALQINVPAPNDRKASIRAYQSERDQQQYFLATIPAGDHPVPSEPGTPADVMVVVDTSGSAGNLQRARLAVRTIVNQLRPEDRVQIGCVDVEFRPLTTEWLVPGDEAVTAAYHQLQQEIALGGSSLDQSLDGVLRELMKGESPRRKLLVYIGDGVGTLNRQSHFWKPHMDPKAGNPPRLCLLHLGASQEESQWMHKAAQESGGRYFDLDASANGFDDLMEWSLRGLPTPRNRVVVEVDGAPATDVVPDDVWTMGQDLHILGRRAPSPEIKLRVMVEDQPAKTYELAIPPSEKDDAVFTGRLWAQHRLRRLLREYGKSTGANQDRLQSDIVLLCQEWSLMSPFTAFLVLESEEDYARWKIDRRLRHRYWSPPEALPAVPLPDHVKLFRPAQFGRWQGSNPWQAANPHDPDQRKRNEAWDREFVKESLQQAQKSLQTGDVITAHLHLARVRDRALKWQPEAFEELHRTVSAKMERESALQQLGMWRPVADRLAMGILAPAQPFLPILIQGGVDPAYVERNPHIMKLIKPIKVPEQASVRDFASAVQEQLGIPVLIMEAEIAGDGGSIDQPVFTKGLEGISAYNLIRHALEPCELDLVYDDHIFLITTLSKCQEKMSTHLYPVGDLLRTDHLPPPIRLANPLLDQEEFARQRIETRLKQPISVNFVNTPLREALDEISEKTGVPFRLCEHEIYGDGGSVDQRLTLKLANIPADVVIKSTLQPMELSQLISREILMVTTMAKAEERMETRIYSAAGVADGLAPDPVRNPNLWGGMGGFGGMGGGMGGMGGGVFGGEAIGGAIGGAPGGVSNQPTSGEAGLSEIAPYEDEQENDLAPSAPSPPAMFPADPASAPQWPNFSTGGGSSSTTNIGPAMNLIQHNSSGEWSDDEGVGGRMSWFPNAVSLIVTQTPRVHHELHDLFNKMRQAADRDPATQLRRPRVRRIGPNDAVRNYGSLMQVLQQHTSGEWADFGGWGGNLQPHAPTMSLAVRQTGRVHTEIEALLTRLRRTRYVAETIPTRETLDGIDSELNLFNQSVLTTLPRVENLPEVAQEQRTEMSDRLAVRKPATALNQRWRRIINASGPSEFTLRSFERRLQLETTDRILRSDGTHAAVAYPRLGLAEVDAWGESVRKIADGLLPWLPHRTNDELLSLFEVTVLAQTPEIVTLGLTFRKSRDLQIRAEFSQSTGRPLTWAVMNDRELQYRLKFAGQLVTASDAQGNELERWELIAEEAPQPIPELVSFHSQYVVVQVADGRDPMNLAREALRRGDYQVATDAFRRWKEQQPDQPLVNFLYAWCLEFSRRPNAADLAEQRTSLQRVVDSEATDLLRWLNPTFFPTLGADGLLELLLAIPEEHRSVVVCDLILELAQSARRYSEALDALRRCLALEPDRPAAAAQQILLIELLLRTRDLSAAQILAENMLERGATTSAICETGDLFYRFDQPDFGAKLYDRVLQRADLPPKERAQLLARQALWLVGPARWKLLFQAEQLLPDDASGQTVYLNTLLSEMRSDLHVSLLLLFAKEARRPAVRRTLIIQAAEVTDDRRLAAQLAWDLFQERGLPNYRVTWMVERLVNAERGKDVIPVLERRLRRGETLDRQTLGLLSRAYRQEMRITDAQRAETHHLDRSVPEETGFRANAGGQGGGFF